MKLYIWESIFSNIRIINKFGNLIELEISLINEIKSVIEEISKFGADLDHNCMKLKFKNPNEMTEVLYRAFNWFYQG
jgi:hypothetical protein